MPPPNQKIGASPALVATNMRTFMCTVGQCGLRGCSTSDTPSASKPRPASCGRAALAEGGNASPETSEKPIPARSKNAPFSRMRVQPPPRRRSSGPRRHACVASGVPSKAPSASAMRDCSVSR